MLLSFILIKLEGILAAQIGCHDDNRVLEIHRNTFGIGNSAIIQDL
jgi:hypothetical protein